MVIIVGKWSTVSVGTPVLLVELELVLVIVSVAGLRSVSNVHVVRE